MIRNCSTPPIIEEPERRYRARQPNAKYSPKPPLLSPHGAYRHSQYLGHWCTTQGTGQQSRCLPSASRTLRLIWFSVPGFTSAPGVPSAAAPSAAFGTVGFTSGPSVMVRGANDKKRRRLRDDANAGKKSSWGLLPLRNRGV